MRTPGLTCASGCLATLLVLAGCADRGDDFHAFSPAEPTQPPVTSSTDAAAPAPGSPSSSSSDSSAPNSTGPNSTGETGDPGVGSSAAAPQSSSAVVAASHSADAPPAESQAAGPPEQNAAGSTDADAAAPTSVDAADTDIADAAATDGADATEAALPGAEEGPRETKLLIPHRDFKVEGPENAIRVSYDDLDLLKILNMEPVTAEATDHFPDWLRNLDGRKIRLRGFMFPPPLSEGLPFFVLARDNQICCFGRNPKAYDIIPVMMRKGVTTHYINSRPFDVVGTFHIQPEMSLDDETKVESLYMIEDAIVIDKEHP